jgi:hypothetical protein
LKAERGERVYASAFALPIAIVCKGEDAMAFIIKVNVRHTDQQHRRCVDL